MNTAADHRVTFLDGRSFSIGQRASAHMTADGHPVAGTIVGFSSSWGATTIIIRTAAGTEHEAYGGQMNDPEEK